VCRETSREGGTNISQPRRELRVYNHVRSNLLQQGTCHERTEIWHKTSDYTLMDKINRSPCNIKYFLITQFVYTHRTQDTTQVNNTKNSCLKYSHKRMLYLYGYSSTLSMHSLTFLVVTASRETLPINKVFIIKVFHSPTDALFINSRNL
jgi:hypothetical protein